MAPRKSKSHTVTFGNVGLLVRERNDEGALQVRQVEGEWETTVIVPAGQSMPEMIAGVNLALSLHMASNTKPSYIKCDDEKLLNALLDHYEISKEQ